VIIVLCHIGIAFPLLMVIDFFHSGPAESQQ